MADSITAAAAVTANVEAGLAITAGAASAATGIASGATEKNNPEVSQKLKWASLGLGVGSAVFGAGAGVAKVRKGLQGLSKRLGRVQEEGLSGRGAIAAGREMAAERNSPLRLRGGGNDDYPTRLPLDNKRYPPSEEVEFIRGKFNAEPGRNIAFMDYDVEGEIGTFASVSGQAKRLGTVSPPVGRRFRTFAVGHARDYDTEVKLLEKFQRVFPDTNARGAIYLHSQLPMCKSCLSVLDQFSKQYEKIAIYVGDGTKSATRFLPS
ncbi:deaminase domain-containing protein [Pseudomonas chlororaphis]|uniref:deaminase domain-containing protein n=1 Tax=Pseudomonas chlororaphis TaxID=587753 RepID=UPI001E53CDCA|nr:deaminase domain-containing protein [Pseudomonas chlororaphis]